MSTQEQTGRIQNYSSDINGDLLIRDLFLCVAGWININMGLPTGVTHSSQDMHKHSVFKRLQPFRGSRVINFLPVGWLSWRECHPQEELQTENFTILNCKYWSVSQFILEKYQNGNSVAQSVKRLSPGWTTEWSSTDKVKLFSLLILFRTALEPT
jgi:hypothetical protein